MMNKKIVPVVIGLLLLGGLTYYLKMKPSSMSGEQPSKQTMNEAAEFSKAMESGKPTTCTLTKGSDVMEYVISGKKMRANMSNSVEGKTTVSHMVNDTAYMYMWADGQTQGTKMAVPTEEEAKVMADKAKDYQSKAPTAKFDSAADYKGFEDQGYSIDCKSGSVDDSLFIPPTDVKFIDPTEMMKQATTPGSDGQVDYKKLQEQYGAMQQPGADGVEY